MIAIRRSSQTKDSNLNDQMDSLQKAHTEFAQFSQDKVDKIFLSVAHEASKYRIALAKLAMEETKMGCFEDKVIKNTIVCEMALSRYRHTKTCGIVEVDAVEGITKVAVPKGPVASILNCTHPTSSVILMSLFALKTRNSIAFLPHPKSVVSSREAARLCYNAAVKAGAPKGVFQFIEPSEQNAAALVSQPALKLVLSTGGIEEIKAAYSTGHATYGTGVGNSAVVIDETANLRTAVNSIVLGKTFDNGMVQSSEQSVIIVDKVYDAAKKYLETRGVFMVSGGDKVKLGDYLIKDGKINEETIGQSAASIASALGINIPKGTVVLAAEVTKVGAEEPFSYEKLSPVMGIYRAKDFNHACNIAKSIVLFRGQRHSSAVYTKNAANKEYFGKQIPAYHIKVNMPTSLGAIASSYNSSVPLSLTLGVKNIHSNALSGNISPLDLLNIKSLIEQDISLPPPKE